MAYQLNKQWKVNGGTIFPGYKLVSDAKSKRNNIKTTNKQPKFIEDYIETHPIYIVKDVIEQPCAAFNGLSVNESTVYRHTAKKQGLTLTHTQTRTTARKVYEYGEYINIITL